jgi:hypothetical protein
MPNKVKLIYHNIQTGGPSVVVKNLIKGLSKTDIQLVDDITKADLVGCLQHPGSVYNKLPRATLMGPNIFVLPDEAPEIWNNFNNYVVPCLWVKDKYENYNLNNEKKLEVWPVGVDTEEWASQTNIKKTLDCFIYYKNRTKDELLNVAKLLKRNKLSFKIIQYGQYQEQQLKDLCNESKFCVLLDNTESQGLSTLQIMSMDLPMFVFNKTKWEYKDNIYNATSVPYFQFLHCGKVLNEYDFISGQDSIQLHFKDFLYNLEKFSPRNYIEENFDLELKARSYLAILEQSFKG